MIHGLAVRRGSVSLLCNGRPVVDRKGILTNGVKTEKIKDFMAALRSTEGTSRRICVPQNALNREVDCCKCGDLIDPVRRAKCMKNIYKNSSTYKNRTKSSPNRINKLEMMEGLARGVHNKVENSSQTIEITPGKVLTLTIRLV